MITVVASRYQQKVNIVKGLEKKKDQVSDKTKNAAKGFRKVATSSGNFDCIVQPRLYNSTSFECLIKSKATPSFIEPFLLSFSSKDSSLIIEALGSFGFGYVIHSSSMSFIEATNQFGMPPVNMMELPLWVGDWTYASSTRCDNGEATHIKVSMGLFMQLLRAFLRPVMGRIMRDVVDDFRVSGEKGEVTAVLKLRGNADELSSMIDIDSANDSHCHKRLCSSTSVCGHMKRERVVMEMHLKDDKIRVHLIVTRREKEAEVERWALSGIRPGNDTLGMTLDRFVTLSLRKSLVLASVAQGVIGSFSDDMKDVFKDVVLFSGVCCECGKVSHDIVRCKRCRMFCVCFDHIDRGRDHIQTCDGSWSINIPISNVMFSSS